jgi:hypothetical protein
MRKRTKLQRANVLRISHDYPTKVLPPLSLEPAMASTSETTRKYVNELKAPHVLRIVESQVFLYYSTEIKRAERRHWVLHRL